jgi:hypothetical protein
MQEYPSPLMGEEKSAAKVIKTQKEHMDIRYLVATLSYGVPT